jgi:very-short-patch-repair endonuclease
LIIEIDGQYHNHIETYELDLQREAELQKHGLTTLRFTELEVRKDMTNVLRTIESYIAEYIDKQNI